MKKKIINKHKKHTQEVTRTRVRQHTIKSVYIGATYVRTNTHTYGEHTRVQARSRVRAHPYVHTQVRTQQK